MIGGIAAYAETQSFVDSTSLIFVYLVTAVVLYAFAELLDSVNAIKRKIVGEEFTQVKHEEPNKEMKRPDNVKP